MSAVAQAAHAAEKRAEAEAALDALRNAVLVTQLSADFDAALPRVIATKDSLWWADQALATAQRGSAAA